MRRLFADELYKWMTIDTDVVLVVGDLGYKMWDEVRDNYPERFINAGASEQAMMDVAVGLALSGKKPFVYSITNFLLYRPFEAIRNYLNYEKIPVRLVASGRYKDYARDGITHWSDDADAVLRCFPNIVQYWPDSKKEIPKIVKEMVEINQPSFVSLKK